MPFQEKTRMQGRQKLAHQVLHEGVSVSQAAREAGVSRVTAHAWIERARREGVVGMQEYSRRPHHSPRRDLSCQGA